MAIAHPAEPRLSRVLHDAVRRASSSLEQYLKPDLSPAALDWLSQWQARGGTGWRAGDAHTTGLNHPFEGKLAACAYLYGQGFSFQAVIGLVPRGQQWWSAYEHFWAAETMGMLSIAGHFYAEIPAASPLRCDLALVGLAGRTQLPRQPWPP